MALKRHHKILIGSFSLFVISLIIILGVLMYSLYVQEIQHYNVINDKLSELQTTTQSQINSLSSSLLQLQNLTKSSQQNFQSQINLLKASSSGDFSGIIQSSLQSVVTVRTSAAQGTGFIIDSQGYIVTNAHVLADSSGYLASNIQVITENQNTINAQFIGYNGNLDIALLKIPGTYTPLNLGNSGSVQVGDKVIAIGNPLGLQFSVSEGIISAINRQGINGLNYYFQTDASLNPGNSGGPLINQQGQVIGINNFKISGGENLGFALESNYIKQAINNISQQYLNETLINY
ncbi:MAG: trypsin-like peptidase domain-containing protein [Candidatus Pacearchaeota archaeon]|nr:trypsin-like peptidase domain-containing protein [Candidatus Pacearchaeota archaeon]